MVTMFALSDTTTIDFLICQCDQVAKYYPVSDSIVVDREKNVAVHYIDR